MGTKPASGATRNEGEMFSSGASQQPRLLLSTTARFANGAELPTEDTFPGGTNIAHAAVKTLDEAKRTGQYVVNMFNGTYLTAWPDATLREVHECYDLRRRIAHSERRKAEQGDRWANLTGEALLRVAAHQPEPGGCTCGFCAWSVEHVVQLVLNEAAQKCGYRLIEGGSDD